MFALEIEKKKNSSLEIYGVIQLKFRSRAKDSAEITSIYKEIICQAYTLAFNGDHSSTIFRMAFFIQSRRMCHCHVADPVDLE